ncbi:hypothetical protein H8356DRAFT_1275428 [Neocallimastix lanati (nom. inval.)]|nr:hypothetical protein H8356DRAFT_1275428 [Neocallimastix sp. JGI-2020a]
MDNERIELYNSFLDKKRKLSKSNFDKNKFQITNEQNIISNYYSNFNSNKNDDNNGPLLSPIDVNTPPENNSFSYQLKDYLFSSNNNDNVIIRKRKFNSNQEISKKQEVDGIHQNWQRIQKYIKKHSETEEEIQNLKNIFETFSSKTVPEQYKEDQLLLDIWLEFIHILIHASNNVKEIQNCFKYLRIHKIGRKKAQFYLEWAEFERKQGNYEKAVSIISLGIEYDARPQISLKSKLKIYQNLLNHFENENNDTINNNSFIKKTVNSNKDEQYKIDFHNKVELNNKELNNKESYDISNKENKSELNKKVSAI